jgi:prepilin-type N-terminal cleavage/methylation domain-containing protein
MNHPKRRERGFTLIEMLVVLAILSIAVLLAAPFLSKQIQRSKLIGAAQQAAGLMRQARMDAIKHSQCAMVRIDVASKKVEALSDRDGDCKPSAADVRIGEVQLPNGVSFTSPCGTGAASVRGLTSAGADPAFAVFQGDGAAQKDGAFRFQAVELGGRAPNYLEVFLSPAATARVRVRKWRGGGSMDCDNNTLWHTNGDGGSWTWS